MTQALPVFITSNQNKADYLARTLGVKLEHKKIDLDEIQSTSTLEIIEHKVKQAYRIIGRPVLVEDTSLSFNVLGNLPGPFIKFFVEAPDGLEKLCRMLDGFDDRSACASAVYGYYDGTAMSTFEGKLNGAIASHPRGDGGYGWDKIFEPAGYGGRTRGELSPVEDIDSYNQIRDFQGLRDFLNYRL